MAPKTSLAPALDVAIDIRAMPRAVIDAFFDGNALARWWGADRSVTAPRPFGPYAIEWTSEERDDVLGRLGGVFRGTIMQYQPNRGFFVADVFFLPPDGDPIGPMAFEVTLATICQASTRSIHSASLGARVVATVQPDGSSVTRSGVCTR